MKYLSDALNFDLFSELILIPQLHILVSHQILVTQCSFHKGSQIHSAWPTNASFYSIVLSVSCHVPLKHSICFSCTIGM